MNKSINSIRLTPTPSSNNILNFFSSMNVLLLLVVGHIQLERSRTIKTKPWANNL